MSNFSDDVEALMRKHHIDGALVISLKAGPDEGDTGTMSCAMACIMPPDDRIAQLTIMACKAAAEGALQTMAAEGTFKSVADHA